MVPPVPRPFRPDAATGSAPPGERIAKVLARAGVASRRDAEAIIAAGRVQVNGKRIDSPALNVAATDRILVDGKPLAAPEPPRLWLYHKPAGLVTSARDEKGRATVFDRLPEGMPRVMPVGRLDISSEGLLLLTNDGELKRRLELPSTGWLRKYRVRVNGKPGEARLEPLRKGITVDGERFQPMQVSLDRQQGANAWLTVGIREGKNREVRRAMEAVGLVVNRLIRTGYGPFQLGELAPGAVDEVRPRVLRDQLGPDALPTPARMTRRAPDAEDTSPKPARATRGQGARQKRPVASSGSKKRAPKGAPTPGSPRGPGARERPATSSGSSPGAPKTPGAPRGPEERRKSPAASFGSPKGSPKGAPKSSGGRAGAAREPAPRAPRSPATKGQGASGAPRRPRPRS
jgi:23S rRNA pseudouridine2605 synthase